MSRRSPMLLLAGAAAGMIAWAAQFTLIYGATAIACARGYEGAWLLGMRVIPLTIVGVTLAALGVTGFVLARRSPRAAVPSPATRPVPERRHDPDRRPVARCYPLARPTRPDRATLLVGQRRSPWARNQR